MRLVEVKLSNFRGYLNESSVKIDSLTLLVGKNDAGKSSFLDALDIFFNESQIDRSDCNVKSGLTDVIISCVFSDLPEELIIDDQAATNLADEYLLRSDGLLEIIKVYDCAAAKGKLSSIFAIANHPANDGVDDLLALKISDLRSKVAQKILNTDNINMSVKSQIRRALWEQTEKLVLSERRIALKKESAKDVYDQLALHMPVYAIFRSDRPSTDQDAEAQDPLKAAVKAAIRRREKELNDVIVDIKQELSLVARRTVEKIREMNPDLAGQLTPEVKNKNWDSLFSISLTGDDAVPLNKRGSGTRRLVLLNFFRAQAEDSSIDKGSGIIYAIEEPETSQHPNQQIMLLDAFEDLVNNDRCQILMTTHTPTLARRVDSSCLRYIYKNEGYPSIECGSEEVVLDKITKSLGILPDHGVKVFFGVEGKHDISFLRNISSILHACEPDIPCLESAEKAGELIFVPLGGSSLELWVSRLASLKRAEFYLTDRDLAPPKYPKYHDFLEKWRERGCVAWATSRRELENYVHHSIIAAEVPGYAGNGQDFEDVPLLVAEAVHCAVSATVPWAQLDEKSKKEKSSNAKKKINNQFVSLMTPDLLSQVDPRDELRGWLREIGSILNK